MADPDSFTADLSVFVRTQAQGNKTRAAALLEITRPEVHAYLKGRRPRADKLSRLKAIMAQDVVARPQPPADKSEQASAELAFQLVRYLYDLVEDARARARR